MEADEAPTRTFAQVAQEDEVVVDPRPAVARQQGQPYHVGPQVVDIDPDIYHHINIDIGPWRASG